MFKNKKEKLGPKTSILDIPNNIITLFGNTTLPPRLGTRELLIIYSQSPWLRTIVNKIGKSVGDTDWALYRLKNGWNYNKIARSSVYTRERLFKKEIDINNVIEVTDNPILDLLEYGNESMLGKTVIQLTCQYLDLVGEAFWVIERNQLGEPCAIWPLPPTWVKDIPNSKEPYYTVSSDFGGTAQLKIPDTEVIYFKEPDLSDPYGRGSGMGKSLGDEIEISEFSSKFTKSFFYNDARPSLIISGDNIGKEDSKRLEHKVIEDHQGFMKAFKPLFFSRKVDVKEISLKLDDMQLKELRDQERDTFIQVYNCPPEVFGIVNDSKRSTITAADYFFQKFIIRPRMEFIREVIQLKLIPQFGNTNKFILDYESPIVQDSEYNLEVMKAAPWAFSINQWKTAASEKTIGKNGDVYVVPLNQGIVSEKDLGAGTLEKPTSNSEVNNPDLNKKKTIMKIREILQDIKDDKGVSKKDLILLSEVLSSQQP